MRVVQRRGRVSVCVLEVVSRGLNRNLSVRMGWGWVTKVSLLVFVASLFLLSCTAQARPNSIVDYPTHQLQSEDDLLDLFHSWLEKHSRVYHSLSEKQHRFEIFKDNLRYIHAHNQQQKPYWLGLNKFSDLTHDEFRAQYLGTRPGRMNRVRKDKDFIYKDVEVPAEVDWRAKGAVAEVKDQGSCGNYLNPYYLMQYICLGSLVLVVGRWLF